MQEEASREKKDTRWMTMMMITTDTTFTIAGEREVEGEWEVDVEGVG
jgi:hypothetical protein